MIPSFYTDLGLDVTDTSCFAYLPIYPSKELSEHLLHQFVGIEKTQNKILDASPIRYNSLHRGIDHKLKSVEIKDYTVDYTVVSDEFCDMLRMAFGIRVETNWRRKLKFSVCLQPANSFCKSRCDTRGPSIVFILIGSGEFYWDFYADDRDIIESIRPIGKKCMLINHSAWSSRYNYGDKDIMMLSVSDVDSIGQPVVFEHVLETIKSKLELPLSWMEIPLSW